MTEHPGILPKLEVRNLRKTFGSLAASDGASLEVAKGTIHAVIGPNGAGKTTMISLISGELLPDSGEILLDGRNITRMPIYRRAPLGMARSYQVSQLFEDFTVEDNVAIAVQASSGIRYNFWRNAFSYSRLREPARHALSQIGLSDRAKVKVSSLAHGEKRQLELAIALAMNASILLLDEPMAGLGAEESKRMKEILESLKEKYTIILVEHDMDIVFSLADQVTVLVFGQSIFTGRPEEVSAHPEVRKAYLGEE